MKLRVESVPILSIGVFADRHDLSMTVRERFHEPVGSPVRFFASFDNVEVKDRGCLVSVFGSGRTPDEAIDDYASRISQRRLVVDAYRDTRRELAPVRMLSARGGTDG